MVTQWKRNIAGSLGILSLAGALSLGGPWKVQAADYSNTDSFPAAQLTPGGIVNGLKVYRVLDANGQPYENISLSSGHYNAFNKGAFPTPEPVENNTLVIVEGKKFELDYTQPQGLVLMTGDSRNHKFLHIGTEDAPMDSITVGGACRLWQHDALIAPRGSANGISLIGRNISLFVDDAHYPGLESRPTHRMVMTDGARADGSWIKVQAQEKLTISGDIGVGLVRGWVAAVTDPNAFGLTGSSGGRIEINTDEALGGGTVQIDGVLGAAQYGNSANALRGNQLLVRFPTADSWLRGKTADYCIGLERDSAVDEGVRLRFERGARWMMTGSSSLSDLHLDETSAVDVAYSDAGFPKEGMRALSVYRRMSGSGSVKMDIDPENKVSDRLFVYGTHEGSHRIDLVNVGAGTEGAEGTVLAFVKDERGEFRAGDTEGALYWNSYELGRADRAAGDEMEYDSFDTQWYLKKAAIIPDPVEPDKPKPTTTVRIDAAANAVNYHAWRTANDQLHSRLGELRLDGGAKGAWFRVSQSKFERAGQYGLENKYSAYELGYDFLNLLPDGTRRHYGASFSYLDGESDYRRGTGDNDGKTVSLYCTDIRPAGDYIDVVLRAGSLKNDYTVYDSHNRAIEGGFRNFALSLSGEYGRKFAFEGGWYVEPQAQLTFGWLRGDNYATNTGVSVEQENFSSLVGRIGVQAGRSFAKGVLYVRLNLMREFLGDYDVTMSKGNARVRTEDDFRDTWFEYGIGGSLRVGPAAYGYFDVMRSAGSDFKEKWKWNAGLRFEL